MVHTCYSESVVNTMVGILQWSCAKKVLYMPNWTVGDLKGMLLETLNEQCDSGLYPLKCSLLNHIAYDINKFWARSIFDDIPYAHNDVHIKQMYIGASWSGRTRMVESKYVIKGSYDTVLRWPKDEIDGKVNHEEEKRSKQKVMDSILRAKRR